jgi:dihydroorotase
MDEDDLKTFGQVNPPLRSPHDIDSLWSQITAIDCIATDHAPHTREEKDGIPAPSGMPGLETSLSLMLTAANNGRITLPQITQLTSYRPAQIMGFASKGQLAPGYDADLTLVDMRENWIVKDSDMHSRCGWTPFAGRQLTGRVKQVYLRGKRVYKDGTIEVIPGYGKALQQS